MQPFNALEELDALLNKSDLDSSDWSEYGYEDGEALLAKLDAASRVVLFAKTDTRPENWRGCLASILRPSDRDEGEALIAALFDANENVAGEALRRLYFYCGFNSTAKRGALEVFEDVRHRVAPFWERIRADQGVMQKVKNLSQGNQNFTGYWRVFSDAATAPGQKS